MKAQFRPTSPADAPAIAEFLGRIFKAKPGDPILDRAMMQWKYWSDHPDWQGSRGFVLERGQTIVGHGAAWPARILAAQPIPCFFLIDWAASPDFPGAGVSIMKHMAQLLPVNFLYDGTEIARKMRFAMGYRSRNQVWTLALPVRPLRQILNSGRWNWKTPARLARNLAWSRFRSRPAVRWQSRIVDPSTISSSGLVWPAAAPGRLAVERTRALFEFVARCPLAPARFSLASRDGQPMGYFCLTFPSGQARIADAWIASAEIDDWVELYTLASDQARRNPGVNEIVAATTAEIGLAALQQCGFHLRTSDPVQLYDPKNLIPPELPLDVQLIDGDAAFRSAGGADYLT